MNTLRACLTLFLVLTALGSAADGEPEDSKRLPPRLDGHHISELSWLTGRWVGDNEGFPAEMIFSGIDTRSIIGMSRCDFQLAYTYDIFTFVESPPMGDSTSTVLTLSFRPVEGDWLLSRDSTLDIPDGGSLMFLTAIDAHSVTFTNNDERSHFRSITLTRAGTKLTYGGELVYGAEHSTGGVSFELAPWPGAENVGDCGTSITTHSP